MVIRHWLKHGLWNGQRSRSRTTMASEILTRHVAKFDGTNIQGWKFQMKAVFIANDLLAIVDGSKVKPNDATSDACKAWTKDNAKAMFIMASAMESKHLDCVLVLETAKEMWDKMCTIHEQKS